MVTQSVYGGKIHIWTALKGQEFGFNYINSRCDSYIVVQSGLNNYIFETSAVELVEETVTLKEPE